MRREVEFFNEPQTEGEENRSGIRLTVTRKGIEVVGWYDHFVGLQPFDLTWEQIEQARKSVNTRVPRPEPVRGPLSLCEHGDYMIECMDASHEASPSVENP